MVLRLQDSQTLSGGAASLFKSAADLTVESARAQAQGLTSLGEGLQKAAYGHAALKQRKFENSMEQQRFGLDATYKQYEMDHGNAALLMENAARYRQQAHEAGLAGDQAGYDSFTQMSADSLKAAQIPINRITQGKAAGLELGADGRARMSGSESDFNPPGYAAEVGRQYISEMGATPAAAADPQSTRAALDMAAERLRVMGEQQYHDAEKITNPERRTAAQRKAADMLAESAGKASLSKQLSEKDAEEKQIRVRQSDTASQMAKEPSLAERTARLKTMQREKFSDLQDVDPRNMTPALVDDLWARFDAKRKKVEYPLALAGGKDVITDENKRIEDIRKTAHEEAGREFTMKRDEAHEAAASRLIKERGTQAEHLAELRSRLSPKAGKSEVDAEISRLHKEHNELLATLNPMGGATIDKTYETSANSRLRAIEQRTMELNPIGPAADAPDWVPPVMRERWKGLSEEDRAKVKKSIGKE